MLQLCFGMREGLSSDSSMTTHQYDHRKERRSNGHGANIMDSEYVEKIELDVCLPEYAEAESFCFYEDPKKRAVELYKRTPSTFYMMLTDDLGYGSPKTSTVTWDFPNWELVPEDGRSVFTEVESPAEWDNVGMPNEMSASSMACDVLHDLGSSARRLNRIRFPNILTITVVGPFMILVSVGCQAFSSRLSSVYSREINAHRGARRRCMSM